MKRIHMTSMIADPLIMLVAAILGTCLIPLVWRLPGAGIAIALLSFTLTAIQVPISVDPRLALVVVTAIHLLRNMTTGRRILHLSALRPFIFASSVLCGWMLLSLWWSEKFEETLGAVLAYASVLVFIAAYSEYLLSRESKRIVACILTVLMAISLLSIFGQASWAFLGERARGITNNPNALGIFSIFWMAAMSSMRWRYLLPVWILGMISIVMAASRASMAAGIVVIVIVVFLRIKSNIHKAFFTAGLSISALWFVTYGFEMLARSTEAQVLRTNNSRTDEVDAAIHLFEKYPWGGGGAGAYAIEPGSFLKLAAELGLIGLLIAGLLVMTYVLRTRADLVAFSFVGGALTNGAIEGWLFTGGSVYLLFLLVIITGAKTANRRILVKRLPVTSSRKREVHSLSVGIEGLYDPPAQS